MKKLAIIFLISCIGFSTNGQIIHVPADYPTIQEGIDAAGSWFDTVLVAPGTYYENISFIGKRITVASNFIMSGDTMDIINTVIDGSQPANPDIGSTVSFASYEDTTSIICGFTITGGTGTYVPAVDVRSGGGIAIGYSGAKIIHNIIENNSVNGTHADGGGIGFGPPGDPGFVVIRNNKIRNNEAISTESAGGGGITSGNAIISNNIIQGNLARNTGSGSIYKCSGGGIFSSGSDNPEPVYIEFQGNVISGNKSISESTDEWNGYGGGISLYNVYGLIKNNTITENEISTANKCLGCGIVCMYSDTSLLIEGNTIAHNYYGDGQSFGGGIMFYNASARLENNMIYKNHAALGGGLYIWDSDGGSGNTQMINNTIVDNEADEYGGAIYNDNTVSYVFNSIIWDNESSGGEELSGDYEVRYSDIEGEFTGEGNIDADPEFIDPDNDDYHIQDYSPCCNMGYKFIVIGGTMLQSPTIDFDGEDRPDNYSMIPDIGADEHPFPEGIDNPSGSGLDISVYPNPCADAVRLRLTNNEQRLTISDLYLISGRKVRELVNGEMMPGTYELEIDVSDLPEGVYFIRLQAGNEVAVRKLLVVE
ncbi:MAG: T9SS type A sorting domain-containing protein, partial [Bacteroidota bacterium]|nr:T9SS type A sorting domain-containing protein [Bacteroidota bacterium]